MALPKMAEQSSMLPSTSLILGDFAASFSAEAEAFVRVRARIVKSAFSARRALMTAPPCLPVAPVTRIALDIVGFVWF